MQMFQTFRNACIALVQKDAIAEVRSAVKLLPLHIPQADYAHMHTYQHQARGILVAVCENQNGENDSGLF